MKIIIAGNLGYIGPSVTAQLRSTFPDAELIGFDIGYFAHCLTNPYAFPEVKLDKQVFGDIRKFPADMRNYRNQKIDHGKYFISSEVQSYHQG